MHAAALTPESVPPEFVFWDSDREPFEAFDARRREWFRINAPDLERAMCAEYQRRLRADEAPPWQLAGGRYDPRRLLCDEGIRDP